jgi:hypothetical protein
MCSSLVEACLRPGLTACYILMTDDQVAIRRDRRHGSQGCGRDHLPRPERGGEHGRLRAQVRQPDGTPLPLGRPPLGLTDGLMCRYANRWRRSAASWTTSSSRWTRGCASARTWTCWRPRASRTRGRSTATFRSRSLKVAQSRSIVSVVRPSPVKGKRRGRFRPQARAIKRKKIAFVPVEPYNHVKMVTLISIFIFIRPVNTYTRV